MKAGICGQCNVGLVCFCFVYCEAFSLVYGVFLKSLLQYCIGLLVCFYLISALMWLSYWRIKRNNKFTCQLAYIWK